MTATLTDIRRDTSKVLKQVDISGEVVLTEHGEARYKITPLRSIDRKAAAAALRAIGPVAFKPRK